MVPTLADDAHSFVTVKQWSAALLRRTESLEVDPRTGNPPASTSKENVDNINPQTLRGS